MNKKLISLLITGAMLTSVSAAFAADTEIEPIAETTAEQITEDKAVANQYIGEVKSVDKNIVTVGVETEDGEYDAAFGINEETLVYDINGKEQEAVKQGDKVIVISAAGLLSRDIKPAIAIIINNDDIPASVYYDTFSKTEDGFISSDGELVLNIEEEKKKEYEGKTLLVFYNMMTMSIPAQTNPTEIVVVENEETEMPEETDKSDESDDLINKYKGLVKSFEENNLNIEIDGTDYLFIVPEGSPVLSLDLNEKQDSAAQIKEGDTVIIFSEDALHTKNIKEAEAVITNAAEENSMFVELKKFNKTEEGFISEDNELALNISEEEQDNCDGKKLLVFYKSATKSIPAQTTPEAIVKIENDEDIKENGKVSISFELGDSVLNINGTEIEVEKPYVVGIGITLVPLRVISEAFGAEVDWDGDTKTVSVDYDNKSIKLQIDIKTAVIDGDIDYELEEAPQLTENGFTMVPLRFISESLGADVNYDEETKGITVELNR